MSVKPEYLGKTPIHPHHQRRMPNPILHQLLNQSPIMLNPLIVHGITVPQRDHPAPREREPVRRHAVLLQQRDVLLPPPVRVRRDVARVAALGRARRVREGVPDGRSSVGGCG